MSAFDSAANVRFWPKADITSCTAHVHFGGKADMCKCLLLTHSGLTITSFDNKIKSLDHKFWPHQIEISRGDLLSCLAFFIDSNRGKHDDHRIY